MANRDSLVVDLFKEGVLYKDILTVCRCARYQLSARHLRRLLKNSGFSRRNFADLYETAAFVDTMVQESGCLHGYRWMHERCLAHGLRPRKEDVRLVLSALDPAGVEARRCHRLRRRVYCAAGPNFTWHIDGYDKLKPFGLCIHGCIDGFSRKLIWLCVSSTNNDPKVVAGYYVSSVKFLGGCPLTVHGDCGTENVCIRDFQTYLLGGDVRRGRPVYMSGSSTANQRIEAFWGQLRKECIDFWLAVLHELQESDNFCGDFIDKSLIQLCFMGILQVFSLNLINTITCGVLAYFLFVQSFPEFSSPPYNFLYDLLDLMPPLQEQSLYPGSLYYRQQFISNILCFSMLYGLMLYS